MIGELNELVKKDRIVFGARECVRHSKKLDRVAVASDARTDIGEKLRGLGHDVEILELSKDELAEKLGTGFSCEVFGVKKK